MKPMSEEQNKTLFFIKSPNHRLTAIESFLKKRNYDVYIETDVKESLIKVIELQPDFVFIALDHPNQKVNSLPQIIDQSIMTHIIPFVQNSTKEEIRKLNYGGFAHKIFPPISGPAIERLINKITKEKTLDAQETVEVQPKRTSIGHDKEEMIQIKSKAVQNFDAAEDEKASENGQSTATEKKSSVIIQKGRRSQELKTKNDFLSKTKKTSLDEVKRSQLKKDFDEKIKSDLIDVIETYQQVMPANHETPDYELSNEETELLLENSKKAHCLLIQSESWCGYLVAHCNIEIELSALEPVFKNWVNQQFENVYTSEDSDYFEISIDPKNFKTWAEKKSDYFEVVDVNQSKLIICFFPIEPAELVVHVNEENDLIEVLLELIPVDTDLDLSLYLHLPENKKYLLYTPTHQRLSFSQKQKLIDKKVEKLFTPSEFEKEYKKILTEKQLEQLFEELLRESSV
jgi:hypothetical protein